MASCVCDHLASNTIGQYASVAVSRVYANNTRDYFHITSDYGAFFREEFDLGCLCLTSHVALCDLFRATVVVADVFRLHLNDFRFYFYLLRLVFVWN